MFKNRLDIKQIKKYAVLAPRWLGENTFFGFFILFFAALLLSSFVFYQYVVGARNAELESQISQTTFQERTLQNIQETWQERETRFREVNTQQIRNLFASPAPEPESTEQTPDETEEEEIIDL